MVDKIQTLETRLRNDPMVSTEIMDQLKTRRAKGFLSDAQYHDELEKLNDAPLDISLGAGSTSFLNDWKEISVALEEMEHTLEKRANIQFKLGTSGVPIGIALVLGALAISVYFKVPFIAAAGLAGILVTALGVHGFLILRVHQQASLAAERLAEKRVALMFMRLAISSPRKRQSDRLLAAGMSMFLGHQAAQTLPLSADDLPATRKPEGS